MSKAVLVMDMPSSCEECNLQQYGICHAVRKSIVGTPTDLKSKPDWCPLKPMPEKKKERYGINRRISAEHWETYGEKTDSVAVGYNACIDELLKGEEG